MLNVTTTAITGLLVIDPESQHDLRGVERTIFHPTQYAAFGMTTRFASDRFIRGFQGSLRGLYTLPDDQAMLLTLMRGDICLAVADIRPGSRQFGQTMLIDLSDTQTRQVYLSGGLSYGIYVRNDEADWHEKYTGFFDSASASGIFWNDADLNIAWPSRFPLLSERDAALPSIKKLVGV